MKTLATKTNPFNQNIELGKVSWYRDYDEALALSKSTQKPILLFFQEIPGCSTCVNFGRDVLMHPLMVEVIENEFIPLAIYNNRQGRDAEILQLYNEPSWNNPVAHFIDGNGKDLIPKLANNYHVFSMYNKIEEVLLLQNKELPEYFKLLKNDLNLIYNQSETTIIETPCFWSGETTFAQNKAVVATEAGWINSAEVVKVNYDSELISEKELNEYALEQGFFLIDGHENYRVDKNPQYYLKQSKFKYLPLSKAQKTKINLALPYQQNPEQFLSPKQLAWFNNSKLATVGNENAYALDFEKSWQELDEKL